MSKLSKILTTTAVLGTVAGVATYFVKKYMNEHPADSAAEDVAEDGEITREYMSLKKEVETSFGEVNDAEYETAEEAAEELSKEIQENVDPEAL